MHSGTKTVLGALYRSGSCAEIDTSLMDYLENTLDDVRRLGSNVIIAGDINVHNSAWLQSSKITRAVEYLEEVCAAHHLADMSPSQPAVAILSILSSPISHTPYAPQPMHHLDDLIMPLLLPSFSNSIHDAKILLFDRFGEIRLCRLAPSESLPPQRRLARQDPWVCGAVLSARN